MTTLSINRSVHTVALAGAALILALLSGCAAQPIANEAATAATHLQDQQSALTSAQSHLNEATLRLSTQPDPHHASDEISAADSEVNRALQLAHTLGKEIAGLGGEAVQLKAQIDAHQNDLLGPRAKRIRNRVITLGVLITLGIVLLQVGPLFGGPFGAGVVIAGHLLTAFASPLFGGAWKLLRYAGRAAGSVLTKLSARFFGPASSSSPAPAPAPGS